MSFIAIRNCQPTEVSISLGKDPWNAKVVILNAEYQSFTVVANLLKGCEATDKIIYNWEIAYVDKKSGVFISTFLLGSGTRNNELSLHEAGIRSPGLKYIRCVIRSINNMGTYIYDFGFIEMISMLPLQCAINPSQGKAILDQFTLRCSGAMYNDTEANGCTVSLDVGGKHLIIERRQCIDFGKIRLPPGNPVENYTILLNIEADFLAFRSMFRQVSVKVGCHIFLVWFNNSVTALILSLS